MKPTNVTATIEAGNIRLCADTVPGATYRWWFGPGESGPWSLMSEFGASSANFAALPRDASDSYSIWLMCRMTLNGAEGEPAIVGPITLPAYPSEAPVAPAIALAAYSGGVLSLALTDNSKTESGYRWEIADSPVGPWSVLAEVPANQLTARGTVTLGDAPRTVYVAASALGASGVSERTVSGPIALPAKAPPPPPIPDPLPDITGTRARRSWFRRLFPSLARWLGL